jgi:glycosyltransferase involved in cell wall biosynthesis/SAM-dependent methyltransferase
LKSETEIDVGATTSHPSRTERPIKICMHVLAQGRSDAQVLRAMRSSSVLVEGGYAVSLVYVEVERNLPAQQEIDGISMQHLIVPDWHRSRRFEPWFLAVAVKTFILSILRLIRMRADIYHACELTALPACYIVSRLLHKSLIFEAFDLQLPVPGTKIAFWRWIGATFYDLLLPRCMGVIVTSPLHAREIGKRYHVPEITLVRNIPKYQAVQKTDRLREHLGLRLHTRIALYHGNIAFDRGLDRLIREARFLEPNIVIIMMGKGVGTTQTELEALILSEGVADRVRIIPPVPYQELFDWAASADIGLIVHKPDFSLNVQTLLPNKLFEYLMAGLPLLTSELGAVTEIVKSYGVGRIVTSVEPGAIAAAINAMMVDAAARGRMRQNALEAAKNDLNWEKESMQLIGLYEDVVLKLKEKRNASEPEINSAGMAIQSGNRSIKTASIYTSKFFGTRQTQTRKAASRIVPKVLEMIQPTSVIDVGCGSGEFLAAFWEHGIVDIMGIDGPYVQQNQLVIPQESFVSFDLNQPFALDRTYDLVVCVEVAEHLPPQSAPGFIASLTRLASNILFSAAIPYQRGNGHLNEQWPEYWADLFKQHGFVPVDALRRSIWYDREIPYWYRQNMLFFCSEESLAGNEKLVEAYKTTDPGALSVVHPELYLKCNTKYLRILQSILLQLEPMWRIKEKVLKMEKPIKRSI